MASEEPDSDPEEKTFEPEAVVILREAWGPRPGRRVKPEEVYTQRYYRVLLSNGKEDDVLADDRYGQLREQSVDANPFYAEVVCKWRQDHTIPLVPPIPEQNRRKKA